MKIFLHPSNSQRLMITLIGITTIVYVFGAKNVTPTKAPTLSNTIQQVLRLQVSNGTNNDEAIIIFNEDASNGYDDYDSPDPTDI